MDVKIKDNFEKTRQVKNNDKSEKNTYSVDKEMRDIMIEFYQIRRNLII